MNETIRIFESEKQYIDIRMGVAPIVAVKQSTKVRDLDGSEFDYEQEIHIGFDEILKMADIIQRRRDEQFKLDEEEWLHELDDIERREAV